MERMCLSSCVFWKLLSTLLSFINESTRPSTDTKMITSGNAHGELNDEFKTKIHFCLQLIDIFFPVEEYEEYSRHTFLIEINDLVFQATPPNSELRKSMTVFPFTTVGFGWNPCSWKWWLALSYAVCACLEFLNVLLLFFCYVCLKCCLFTIVLCNI